MSRIDPPTASRDSYGRYFWCIKSDLSSDGEIYVRADRLEVTSDGALIAWGGRRYDEGDANPNDAHSVLIIAFGRWKAAYAADWFDGEPVAIEHWKGEVERR
jgi:hypothetical protein